jgi:hypothetical protein
MNKSLMIFGIVGFAITSLILIFLLVKGAKYYHQNSNPEASVSSQGETSQNSNYIDEARNTKAEADMKSIISNLELYRSIYNIYPATSSYSDMVSELINKGMLEKAPTKPNSDYQYLYCSDDASAYNLATKYKEEIIVQKGNSSCEPGE